MTGFEVLPESNDDETTAHVTITGTWWPLRRPPVGDVAEHNQPATYQFDFKRPVEDVTTLTGGRLPAAVETSLLDDCRAAIARSPMHYPDGIIPDDATLEVVSMRPESFVDRPLTIYVECRIRGAHLR